MKKLSLNLIKLCNILSDLNFHDGTALGEQLGISRAAIWKMIQKLQNYGVTIQSIKGKGYQIDAPLWLLDAKMIQEESKLPELELMTFEEVNSTNTYLMQHKASSPQACLAEHQTLGKGRFDRAWASPFGQNIYLSVALQLHQDMSTLGGLSLAIGIEVCELLENLYALTCPLSLKWPNDILYDDKKLAGILVEAQVEANGSCRLIIGIGININMVSQQEIPTPWTSIKQIIQKDINRNTLAANLISSIHDCANNFDSKGLTHYQTRWNERDYLHGKAVTLKHFKNGVSGVAEGIDAQGHLLIKLSDGEQKTFSSGETTLQK
ncbi:bifunctional biotin--[acetyl-CoA-carboxylase] ligase/biotin operon repressor BirA [Francisellaceae bacterium]|nr:bifunctional biotin--[acetyl-CoA-carboxylase] ligase/biotin operon repressor BirA [Francisellaceae bacterium]